MMTANHPLFEKDEVFGFHVGTCHLEQLVAVAEDMFTLYSTDRSIAVHVHVAYILHAIHVGRGFIVTSLFSAYPLLGTCLLTTYAHKRMMMMMMMNFNFYPGSAPSAQDADLPGCPAYRNT